MSFLRAVFGRPSRGPEPASVKRQRFWPKQLLRDDRGWATGLYNLVEGREPMDDPALRVDPVTGEQVHRAVRPPLPGVGSRQDHHPHGGRVRLREDAPRVERRWRALPEVPESPDDPPSFDQMMYGPWS